jgi:ligand-binding sensor domain-containing protein
MKKYFLQLLLFLLPGILSAQSGIGQWRTHLPYDEVIDVAVTPGLIYAATPYSLFTYRLKDDKISIFDKVKGLNDLGINKIGYDKKSGQLLVAYSNANIDLIDDKENVTNVPDIFNKYMLGVKTINNIFFKDDFAYLSCSFGIVVLDMKKHEIKDTYYIGPDGSALNVLDMTANDTALFAATAKGIYYSDIHASNPADYRQWHLETRLPVPQQTYNLITDFDGKIYANYTSGNWDGDTLYVFDGHRWKYFLPTNHSHHFQLNTEGNTLLLVNRYWVEGFDASGKSVFYVNKANVNGIQPLAARGDVKNDVWIGTKSKGLLKTQSLNNNQELIQPNGPESVHVFGLDSRGENVWVVPGGYHPDWSKAYIHDGVFSFRDGQWMTLDNTNTPAFDTISDPVCVKIDPANPQTVYVGTFQDGVMKFENQKLTKIYSRNNSSLQPWTANPALVLVSGLDFDDNHNLWVANSGAPQLLSVLKADGTWKSFHLGPNLSSIDVGGLMVDKNNDIWIKKRNNGMVIVYNYNGTVDDPSDDRVKVLNSSRGNGNIQGSTVYSFATDNNGQVWVGTDKGINVFYSPENIFEPGADFDAQQILVPRNDGTGLADILLVTETVTAIAVDGGNRKWVGTQRAGIFLFSPDGLKEIHHFTTENSPLLSNHITGITIDKNGEVFIGTDKGLISYRGTATPGNDTYSEVYAYPNPVRENYTGLIAIKGLVTNASVKITDSYGNLVYETKAEGGQAVWDGYTFNHVHVSTGVYLVFVTNSDGTESMVTKILVIH